MKGETPQKRTVVKSAARALDILEFLTSFSRGMSLSEIGRELGIPLSSLHGLMETLLVKGYLVRDDTTSVYRISSKLIQLASLYHSQNDLISIADPIMESLSRKTGETTSLAILQQDVIVFMHKRTSPNVLQVVNAVGTRLPAHATGLGKVMLACLDNEQIDRLYPDEELVKLTATTISTKTELKKVLEQTRQLGYAFDNGESTPNVWAVASAICNRYSYPVAALSIAAPISRVEDADVPGWCEAITESAREVSQILGFVNE